MEGAASIDACQMPCKPGTVGALGVGPCTICGSGKYSQEKASECTDCEIDTYQQQNGSVFCFACSDGKSTANEAATSELQCKEICPVGYFGSSGLTECTACEKGKFTSSQRSQDCVSCELKMYLDIASGSVCFPCPVGNGTAQRGCSAKEQCVPFCEV